MEWILIKDKQPLGYKKGDWDGKMSDLCLCQDSKGKFHLANFYEYENAEGEWYDQEEYGLRYEIVKWLPVTD